MSLHNLPKAFGKTKKKLEGTLDARIRWRLELNLSDEHIRLHVGCEQEDIGRVRNDKH